MNIRSLLLEDMKVILRRPILWITALLLLVPFIQPQAPTPGKLLPLHLLSQFYVGFIGARMLFVGNTQLPRVATSAPSRGFAIRGRITLFCILALVTVSPAFLVALLRGQLWLVSSVQGEAFLSPVVMVLLAGWTGVVAGTQIGVFWHRKPARSLRETLLLFTELLCWFGLLIATWLPLARVREAAAAAYYVSFWWLLPIFFAALISVIFAVTLSKARES